MGQMNLTITSEVHMKKNNLLLILVILFVFSGCILLGQYVLNGCFFWDCVPERSFHVRDWEIPMTLLPVGSYTDHISAPTDSSNELEGGFQTVYVDQGIVVYIIYRFPRINEAVAEFDHDKRNMIDRNTGEKWQVPSDLTFSSTTADDVYVACGYWSNRYRCQMTSRYQEYVVFLNADINDKVTFARFEKILFYLDEQISSRLYP